TADGHVDVVGRDGRVAGRRIDVAPALEAAVRRHANEHAALNGGDAVNAVDRRTERHVDEDRLDGGDSHEGEHGVGRQRRQGPAASPYEGRAFSAFARHVGARGMRLDHGNYTIGFDPGGRASPPPGPTSWWA